MALSKLQIEGCLVRAIESIDKIISNSDISEQIRAEAINAKDEMYKILAEVSDEAD